MKSMARISSGFKGERIIVVPPHIVEEIKDDELGKELYITDIGFYPHADFHYCERTKEEALNYVLLYCVDGEGWVDICSKHHRIEKDQLFILPANEAYAYGSSQRSPWTIYWIHFNGEKARFFSEGFNKPVHISQNTSSRIGERLDIFEEIYSSLYNGYNKSNLLYATTSFFHFMGTIKYVWEFRECGKKEQKSKDIIALAIHYMRENMSRKLSLCDIANYVGLSESYFSALFAKETELSPLRYLANLRFEQACHYLNNTSMRVNQICPLIGYDDSLYFSRAFAKSMGMSPSEYRSHKSERA